MGALRPWHIILLVVVILVVFGSKRLPDAARSLGRSMRILKAETRGMAEDEAAAKESGHGDAKDSDHTAAKSDPVEHSRDV